MTSSLPKLALPAPLRANEIPSFTHYSVVVRLPDIGRRTLAENQFPPAAAQRLQALIDEIPEGRVRPLEGVPAELGWEEYVQPYLGMNWLEMPWFFAEEYFYLRVLEATGYFVNGAGKANDPYRGQKQLGLESAGESIEILAQQMEYVYSLAEEQRLEAVARLLLLDLWGNQNDLSMWPVEKNSGSSGLSGGSAGPRKDPGAGAAGLSAAREHVLADDTTLLVEFLQRQDPAQTRVDILLDNAGYELVADLALVDFLLERGTAASVVLHAKSYPVFVSDALEEDILATIDWLAGSDHATIRAMAARLHQRLQRGNLRLSHHPFWTSPLAAWEMPADLRAEIGRATLLISKGDANYRRLLGDRHWPYEQPFASVVSYFQPAVLALRTLKSEITTGVPVERYPASDPKWLYSGRWGLIQYAPPASL